MYINNMTIDFATISDLTEMGDLSRNYIEHDLEWSYTPERLKRALKSDTKNVVVAGDDLTD